MRIPHPVAHRHGRGHIPIQFLRDKVIIGPSFQQIISSGCNGDRPVPHMKDALESAAALVSSLAYIYRDPEFIEEVTHRCGVFLRLPSINDFRRNIFTSFGNASRNVLRRLWCHRRTPKGNFP